MYMYIKKREKAPIIKQLFYTLVHVASVMSSLASLKQCFLSFDQPRVKSYHLEDIAIFPYFSIICCDLESE